MKKLLGDSWDNITLVYPQWAWHFHQIQGHTLFLHERQMIDLSCWTTIRTAPEWIIVIELHKKQDPSDSGHLLVWIFWWN